MKEHNGIKLLIILVTLVYLEEFNKKWYNFYINLKILKKLYSLQKSDNNVQPNNFSCVI